MLLARRRSRSESQRLALVRAAGVAYLGLMGVLAVQALRGLPIIQWDMTGAVGLALVGLASVATFAVSLSRKQAPALAAA
jgi:protein-S-isoprenylcysteine O-methyltransferase Ste14